MKRFMLLLVIFSFMMITGCLAGQEKPERPKPATITARPNDQAGEKMVEETIITRAISDFYKDTNEPVLIYEQKPFENECTLVLAEMLRDGEHYPDLHLVSADGKVVLLTRGSYCWKLNYTQFGDYKIFYGLAAVETRNYVENPVPVVKVEAEMDDRTEAVKTREKIIAHIRPKERDTRMFRNTQAYILPVKSQDMPENIFGILSNGDKLNLSQISIDRSEGYMPEYFKVKKRSIYNSFAFTYSPMLSPQEWEQAYSEGETGLKGKTDENGNLNFIYLRPSSGLLKSVHSHELPYDIKSFYLSDSYPWSTSFSPGERVEAVYAKDRKLFDCRIYKLTTETVDKQININSFQVLNADEKNQVKLPTEKGWYLVLLRTEKHGELKSRAGVIFIR
ncbi:MAG: hypothetical protein N2489_07420 [Clostridia bacterium]|nr:hypothetical protein [Clostridia bacterium]